MNDLPSIQEVIKRYGLNADKKLGQNFLFDQNITDKIVRLAGSLEGKTVIEIGPGPGILTRSILAASPEKLIAIEKDPRCVKALNDYLVPSANGILEIHNIDALKTDIYSKLGSDIKIIANLPYNISTELLFKWLDNIDIFESFTLMFQREVAHRIMGKPRTKDYGRLSIKSQWLCEVEHGFDIPPQAFIPAPKVTSSVVHIKPREKPLALAKEKTLDMVCKATFGQRRKTLRASLKQISKDPMALLAKASIDSNARPEELSIEQFCNLANCFED